MTSTVTTAADDRPDLTPQVVLPVLMAAVLILQLSGSTPLVPSPIASLHAWSSWIGRDPVPAAFACIRLAAIVACYHLIAMQLLALVSRWLDEPRLRHTAERLTPRAVSTGARRLAGIGLAAVTTVALPANRAQAEPAEGTAMLRVVDEGAGTASITVVPPASSGGITDDAAQDPGTAAVRVTRPAAPAPEVPDPAPAGPAGEHVVEPGDHLWSIAESTVATTTGEPGAHLAVERYWRQLLVANPDLADPDLLFPGDVITLPPVGHTDASPHGADPRL